jgi:hypothetical protein
MCENPWCPEDAVYRVSAEGTSHAYDVCYDHTFWAKTELKQDFPGRKISKEYLHA